MATSESSADLASRLDFDLGLEFQDGIRQCFRSPVHHPFPSPDGSFFLLATFRRFLFRLTEESVGLALESCLGGRASEFHVQFLSTNHFRFSVFSKEVGFAIYKLRRVITSTFDVYFHLWSNGAPHWEREKRLWEIEQEEEWTKILSKSSHREEKKKVQKRVHFAKNLVQSPPKVTFQPISLSFGSFSCQVYPESNSKEKLVFGDRTLSSWGPENSEAHIAQQKEPMNMAIPAADNSDQILNSNPAHGPPTCSRCIVIGHTRNTCTSSVRCRRCFKLGHLRRHCRVRIRSIHRWVPKSGLPKYEATKAQPTLLW